MRMLGFIVLLSLSCLTTIVSTTVAAEKPTVYELSFWPGTEAESDSRVVKLSHHPCGMVAVARVTTMPPLKGDRSLEPEKVVEFSATGQVLRRWATPVDSTPIAIRGDRLLVEVAATEPVRIWIDIDGKIAPGDSNITAAISPVACKNIFQEFENSAYASCWRYQDLESGNFRILGFEGVCS